jgi:hypothetical protein
MAASSEREKQDIYGIETPESSNKRVRRYVYSQFKKNPKSFFLEWNINKMLIDDGKKWSMPEIIPKVAIFMQKTTTRSNTDCKLFIETVHSAATRLKSLREKKYNVHRNVTEYSLLLVITHDDVKKSLDDESIQEVIHRFNRERNKITFDLRLFNMLNFVIEKKLELKDRCKYRLNICEESFFNDTVQTFFPMSFRYISLLQKR